jgi:LmbE family N-acetylglucosaminyl deacetylase
MTHARSPTAAALAEALAQAQQTYMRHLFHRQVVERPAGHRVLFLAPHPDDIVVGCGGVVQKYLDAGAAVQFLYLTDGRAAASDGSGEAAMADVRAAEARAVAAELGLPESIQIGWSEHSFRETQHRAQLVKHLQHALERFGPDAIYLPYLFDQHPDHRYTNALLAAALQQTSLAPALFGYAVWSLPPPGIVVDITTQLERKKDLIRLYASQVALFDYPTFAESVARWNAVLVGPQCRAAEVFCPFKREAFLAQVGSFDLSGADSDCTNVLLTRPD